MKDLTDRIVPDAGPDGPRLVERPLSIIKNKEIDCIIQLSDSILEVFIDNIISLTYRLYDTGDYALGVFIMSGQVQYRSIEIQTQKDKRNAT